MRRRLRLKAWVFLAVLLPMSIAAASELTTVRRVNDGYHAHYRSADHYAGAFTAAGLRMQRAVYLETFTGIDNYFFVFRRA